MISKTTLTIIMIAFSSVTAQNFRFIPNDEPNFVGTPFGINNRPNIAPSLFNGLSGFNGVIANPAFQFNNNLTSTSTGTFNANNGINGTFTSTNTNGITNGIANNGTTFTAVNNTNGLNTTGTTLNSGVTNVAPVSSNTGPLGNPAVGTGNGLAANGINGGAGPFVTGNGTNGVFGSNNFNGNIINADGSATLAGVTITNGLSSLGQSNLGLGYGNGLGLGLTGYGLDGTIVTRDGTFINNRQPVLNSSPNGTPLDRATGDYNISGPIIVNRGSRFRNTGRVSYSLAYTCISNKCNNESFPVCGVDGITYRNSCQLQCYGVDSFRDGSC